MPTREHLSIVSRLLYPSITVHYPPSAISTYPTLTHEHEANIILRFDFTKPGEWKRSLARARARTCAIRPDSVPCLRPWAERYYGQEHSFLTNNVLSLRTRAAIIDWDHPNSPRQERGGRGIRPGCVLSPRQPSFLRLRHRENSTMHATKIVTGEKMPPPMTEEILRSNPPLPLFFFFRLGSRGFKIGIYIYIFSVLLFFTCGNLLTNGNSFR